MNQEDIEFKYNKAQLMPRLIKEFKTLNLDTKDLDPEWVYRLIAVMAIHKRANIETLVGLMYVDNAQKTADLLQRAIDLDFVDYYSDLDLFVTKGEPSEELQEEFDAYQYPPPMVQRPEWCYSNRDTGYLTIKGSLLLKDNHHDWDICLDHINRLNEIEFSVNLDVARQVSNSWKKLTKQKEDESLEDFQKKKKAFDKYNNSCHEVINFLVHHNNKFYLTNRYDKRGRTYSQGYHINPQGNDWNKAILELHIKESL